MVEDDDDSVGGEPIRDGSVDTAPEDTPPLAKKKLFSYTSHTQPEPPAPCEFIPRSSLQNSVEDEAPAKQTSTPTLFLGASTNNPCSVQHTDSNFESEAIDSGDNNVKEADCWDGQWQKDFDDWVNMV